MQIGARCLNLSHLPKHLGGRRETVRDAEGRVCVLFVSSEYVATPYCIPVYTPCTPYCTLTPSPIACELASCELCSVSPCACRVAMTEDRTHLAHPSRET